MPAVETRYAEALLSAAPSEEAAAGIETAMREFSCQLTQHEELSAFLLNPSIRSEIKTETIQKILSEDSLLVHFLSLLTEKGRLPILPSIYEEYRRLRNAWRNHLDIQVYSSEALDERTLENIREKYREQYGARTAEVHPLIDASLLGGLRIKIGDTYIQDTLRDRLQGLLSFMGMEV